MSALLPHVAAWLAVMSRPFRAATAARPRRLGGLHPVDARGQYVSPKPTSKRNRRGVR